MQSSVSVIIKGIDKATEPIRKVMRSVRELGRLKVTTNLTKSFDNLRTSIRNVGNETGLLVQRFGMLGAAGVGLFAAFTGPASEMENLRFQLKGLYGDAKYLKVFDFIQQFAISSPYDLTTITESLTTLKKFKFDDNNRFKKFLGYLSLYAPEGEKASSAVMQFGQAWGKMKLQMSEIRPMIEAGVDVWGLLQEATGEKNIANLQKMSEKGTITRKVMLKMLDAMGKHSGNPTEILDLWSTKVSNLGDVWKKFADKVMNMKLGDMSMFGIMKKDLQTVTDLLNNGFQGETGKKVASALREIYLTGKEFAIVLMDLGKEIWPVFKGLVAMTGGLGNFIKVVMGVMSLPLVASIIGAVVALVQMGAAFASWIMSTELAWTALGLLLNVMTLLSTPIGWVVAGVALLTAGAALLWANWGAVSKWFADMWAKWGGLIRLIFPPIAWIIDAATAIAQNWQPISSFFQSFWEGAVQVFQWAADMVIKIWTPIQHFFEDLFRGVELFSAKIPNVNAFTGRAYSTSTGNNPALAMGAPVNVSHVPSVMLQPKQDRLDVNMKISGSGRPTITGVKTSGDSKIDFNSMMLGQMVY